jgi:hypothetical protein
VCSENGEETLFGVLYRAPEEDENSILCVITAASKYRNVVFMGDFNHPTVD